jgi:uncharacterized protein YbaR (Trm112 family)
MAFLSVRCSSLDRLLTCHASRVMADKVAAATFDPFEDREAKDEGHAIQWAGSWCHHAAATRLISEFGAIGDAGALDIPASFRPSSYDEWVAEWYVQQTMKIIPSDWAFFVEMELHRDFPLRKPVSVTTPDGRSEVITHIRLTGHIDACAVSPDKKQAVIGDLKRGYDIVDAAEYNWQLAGYTALLTAKFPDLAAVLLRLLQPAAPDRITEAAVHNPADVVALIEAELNALVEDPYTFNTGKPCKYCDAILVCPVFRKDIRLMRETLTKEQIDALPGTVSLDELGELAFHAKKLEYPITRVVKAFKEQLDAVGTVQLKDGTIAEIIEEDGPRQIGDVQFAHTELARKVGDTAAWRTVKMSIGSIETELAATGLQKTSKKPEVETVKKWIDNNLGGVMRREKQKTLMFR